MQLTTSAAQVLAAGAFMGSIAFATTCDMAGDWLFVPGPGVDSSKFYSAVDIPGPGHTGSFNFTFGIRHGPQTVPGYIDADNAVTIKVTDTDTINGQFASNCSYINWQPSSGKQQYNFGAAWCRAWTPGCNYVKPPYMKGFAFWGTFGDYMVLQQAPQQAAVYGMVFGSDKPQVQVEVQGDDGTNYMVDAEINTVNQPFGPGFEYPWPYPGPFTTWKALLKPHAAGGNFRITSRCLNCVDRDPMFNAANISNVTFGDVWYCSGQSNMWLPVGHSFERNNTVDAIHEGQYNNIRIMAGNSGDQSDGIFNPWMTAAQSVVDPKGGVNYPLFQFGAACWYFAQKLADELQKAGKSVPIGLADTAVGGQRIEEYMDNTTISQCTDRLGENIPQWDGPLYGKLVVPFLDMTVKGFLWYQGENNMGGTKGNSIANVGYGCEMVHLVSAWRKNWSKVPGTTDPDAPFGIVTLASSGSEGGPNMGAMRWAQTGNYGVLPNPLIPNSFVAQAYDLDDPWGPNAGPCFEWQCCEAWHAKQNMTACNIGTNNNPKMCDLACAGAADTTPVMGGIHPRDKKPVGDRLGLAAYNTVYGGQGPTTGPTLSGCAVQDGSLVVQFNQTMLKGDTVIIQPYSQTLNMSYLEVMTDPTIFCVEVRKRNESCRSDCELYCPTWAGGSSITNNSALNGHDSQGWQPLNISMAGSSAIKADLSPLGEQPPVAVRYAWGLSECCNKTDPDLYVKYPCGPAPCPLMLGSKSFPANPFIAKIKDGKCECIAPQTCDGSVGHA